MTYFITLGRYRKKTFIIMILSCLAGLLISFFPVFFFFKEKYPDFLESVCLPLFLHRGFDLSEVIKSVSSSFFYSAKILFIIGLSALTSDSRNFCIPACFASGAGSGFACACTALYSGSYIVTFIIPAISLFSLVIISQFSVSSCIFCEISSKKKEIKQLLRDKRAVSLAIKWANACSLLVLSAIAKYTVFELF